MISYIKGKITYLGEDYLILESNDIGYKIYMSKNSLFKLIIDENIIKIYTYMSVKEDGITLFGFLEEKEFDIFNSLLSVSGIGPKGALSFLSGLSPEEIIQAIITNDVKTLSSPKGVGKKAAEKVIVILKDKFKTSNDSFIFEDYQNSDNSSLSEVTEALISLGYTKTEATKCIKSCYEEGMSTEELLRTSLKFMSKF